MCEFGLWNAPRKLFLSLSTTSHIEHAWLFRSGFKSIFSPPFVLILFFFKGDRSVSASSTLKNRIARGGRGDGRGKSERKLHPSSTGSVPFLGENDFSNSFLHSQERCYEWCLHCTRKMEQIFPPEVVNTGYVSYVESMEFFSLF